MAIRDGLLPEFDHEMATTRKFLERTPEEKFGWKPHEKSMTLGRLAGHLAELPMWGQMTIEQDSVDVAPVDAPRQQGFVAESREELLNAFDKNLAAGRNALANVSDETMLKPWSLLAGGKTLMTMPKLAVFRTWVMNHSVHHRAQLGVFLRLLDVPVPSTYGPSADEQG